MTDEELRGRSSFKVLCAWCGGVIRHDSLKESRGMCLECYARMLGDHNRRVPRADLSSKASQR